MRRGESMRGSMKTALVALALLAACSRPGGGSGPKAKRTLPAHLEAAAKRFGEAVLAKNYAAAYELMAASYRERLPYEEFLESITRYRDHVQGELKLEVRASEDDPKTLKDDGMVQMLVPDHLRGHILDEAILAFDVTTGEDKEEGDWVLVMWLTEESGQLRVLNYYQDD